MQWNNVEGFLLEGQALPTQGTEHVPQAMEYAVEPEYLHTMRIPLVRGRFKSAEDNEHAMRVAVIDTSFAQKYLAGQDPIGKHSRVSEFDSDSNQRVEILRTVVGVVGYVNQWGLAEDANRPLQAQMYRTVMQGSAVEMKSLAQKFGVFVRSRTPVGAEAFSQAIRQKLHASNPDLIVSGSETELEVVAGSIASQRFSLALLGAFAGLALLLASIDIYGVLSYRVGQRTQEIGIRMALGARRLDVLRMVLQDWARMTLAGTAIGIAAALGLTRLMASMQFGVKPTDPITFGLVSDHAGKFSM